MGSVRPSSRGSFRFLSCAARLRGIEVTGLGRSDLEGLGDGAALSSAILSVIFLPRLTMPLSLL